MSFFPAVFVSSTVGDVYFCHFNKSVVHLFVLVLKGNLKIQKCKGSYFSLLFSSLSFLCWLL